MRKKLSVYEYIRANWTQLAFAAILLFTLGGVRVEFGSLKEDVQKKTSSIEKVADDVQSIKVEQARQGADLNYLRQAELRRQTAKTP